MKDIHSYASFFVIILLFACSNEKKKADSDTAKTLQIDLSTSLGEKTNIQDIASELTVLTLE